MYNNKLKSIARLLVLTAMLSVPLGASSQYGVNRGLFSRGIEVHEEGNSRGMLPYEWTGGYNLYNQQFGSDDNGGLNIGTQLFGQEAPLGGGWLVLTIAGAAYAYKKRKNNNNKQ